MSLRARSQCARRLGSGPLSAIPTQRQCPLLQVKHAAGRVSATAEASMAGLHGARRKAARRNGSLRRAIGQPDPLQPGTSDLRLNIESLFPPRRSPTRYPGALQTAPKPTDVLMVKSRAVARARKSGQSVGRLDNSRRTIVVVLRNSLLDSVFLFWHETCSYIGTSVFYRKTHDAGQLR